MRLQWQPVGPLPASTYWVRRAVVLGAALLVLLMVVVLLRSLGGGSDTLEPVAAPTEQATEAPSASASPSPTPTEAGECGDEALEVVAGAAQEVYAPGENAQLTLVVRNTSEQPCRRAVGQGAVELLITSGSDRIWSSDDCAPGGPEGVEVLAPGAEYTARATWPGTRSQPGCPRDQPEALPGTYRLVGRAGDLRSEPATFVVRE